MSKIQSEAFAMGWIAQRIEKTSWISFLVWFVLLFAYSTWAFNTDSPWTRALEAAGGILPETKAGIPAIEPTRSLEALGENARDYILWQALDIPYALLNLMTLWAALSLGLKALKLEAGPLRFLMLLPVIYIASELVENAFLAAFASGVLPTAESVVLMQQLATTLKFSSGMPALALGLVSIAIALVAGAVRMVKSRK